ncbi:VLRF1 family aeRF1-type release factor [Lipingzhangella sp. LS1_29]|uniref:VLRF1 family aeRF1-type release factor n=1 Tax=Lipingzhangella rawalii TaxID=2055835 RepID=A0ABU2H0K7_9ACTN|nr:VLRF1 family aeRF1-type release factor [Lipingzhangella rawalii]MDS1268836.1 VLRF1 family aeRF1-type release factor [Lipingzhangella rawalii]
MILDHTTLRDLARMTDEMGVLSVYATADPRDRSSAPAWRLQVNRAIAELRSEVNDIEDRRRRFAQLERLEAIEPELESMLANGEPGMGRALFAPVSGSEIHRLSVQADLGARAVLGQQPYLTPLAEALTLGAPAGVVALSHSTVRILDVRFGMGEEVRTIPVEVESEDWRAMRGPAGGHPGEFARASTQGDLFDRRLEEHVHRYLASIRPQVSAIADEYGWDTIVVTGDAQLVETIRGTLSTTKRTVVLLDRVVESKSPAEIAALARPEIETARLERYRELLRRAREAALSGGPGSVGLSDTLGAWREGRVEHLFLHGARRLSGHCTRDGRCFPSDERPPGEPQESLIPEPDLAERLIREGLTSGVRVTVLPSRVPDLLADDGDMAAILRW